VVPEITDYDERGDKGGWGWFGLEVVGKSLEYNNADLDEDGGRKQHDKGGDEGTGGIIEGNLFRNWTEKEVKDVGIYILETAAKREVREEDEVRMGKQQRQ